MRGKQGYVYQDQKTKSWVARITFTDQAGKRRNVKRAAESKAEARETLKKLARQIEEGEYKPDVDRMTFDHLADFYQENYLIEPVFVDGVKVAGLRRWGEQRSYLSRLREHFGKRLLRSIKYSDIEAFKRGLLAQPTYRNKQRSLANVHRILALLRSVLRVAVREGWLKASPFNAGKPLINLAAEKKNERVLSHDEEKRMLEACLSHPRREHHHALLICAIDTGMRRGELFKLVWRDVDLIAREIRIQAMNAKTLKPRTVPISDRLAVELEKLRDGASDDSLVFGISVKSNVWEVFKRICEDAGLEDVGLHTMRHTFATRLAQAGLPLNDLARLLGHSNVTTTFRYCNQTAETINRAADLLNRMNGIEAVCRN
jgi:integrase